MAVAALGVLELWNEEVDFTSLTFTVRLTKILYFGFSHHLPVQNQNVN